MDVIEGTDTIVQKKIMHTLNCSEECSLNDISLANSETNLFIPDRYMIIQLCQATLDKEISINLCLSGLCLY